MGVNGCRGFRGLAVIRCISAGQQLTNLLIRRLRKILVPATDRVERLRCHRADDAVSLFLHLLAGVGRGDRNRNDDARWILLPQRFDRGVHGGARHRPG
jgi:hypothetical protein